MSKGVGEDEFGSDDENLPSTLHPRGTNGSTYLWRQSLEECSDTFLLDHLPDDGHSSDLRVEVGVLDSGLDDVQWRGDGDGSDGTGNGSDKVCGQLYAQGQRLDLSLCPQVAEE